MFLLSMEYHTLICDIHYYLVKADDCIGIFCTFALDLNE